MVKERYLHIDIARAIAIILVVVGHYQPDHSPLWHKEVIKIIYTFHMPLFLFISGYIYAATQKEIAYKDFIVKKFKRLMIPYFSTSVVIILVKLAFAGILKVDNEVSLKAIYQVFYMPITAGYFLWFLYTLFLIFTFVRFFKTANQRLLLLVIAVVLRFLPVTVPTTFALHFVKDSTIYFAIGLVVINYRDILERFNKVTIIVPVALFVIIYLIQSSISSNILISILDVLLGLVGTWSVISLSKSISSKSNILNINMLIQIGIASYIIYLFHTTFEGFTKALLLRSNLLAALSDNLEFVLSALIIISVGIIGPFVLRRLIVRSRWLSYLFGERPIAVNNQKIAV